MAYQTGSATDFADFFNAALTPFLVSLGWTVTGGPWVLQPAVDIFIDVALPSGQIIEFEKNDFIGSSTNLRIADDGDGPTWNAADAFGVNRVDYTIGMRHKIVGGTQRGTNELSGPFASYHLFGLAEYVYIILEVRPGYFKHIWMGNVDKSGLSYTEECVFFAGHHRPWWPNTTNQSSRYDTESGGGQFTRDVINNVFWRLDPILAGFTETGISAEMIDLHSYPYLPGDVRSGADRDNAWATAVYARSPLAVSNVSPLFGFPVIYTLNNLTYFLGALPDVRIVSMVNRGALEEMVIGTDTWVLVPLYHNSPFLEILNPPASPALTGTSWRYGLAYKKIV